jgi:DUF4097 and DUF4098 domain-containing protein YvlB
MPLVKRRPSLMGGLVWTGLGLVILLRNFGIGPDFWSMAGRYWPILLILLGLGKVIDYYRQKEGVALRVGEVFGLIFLLIAGAFFTKLSGGPIRALFREGPAIDFGGGRVRPGDWIGTSHSFSQEAAYPVDAAVPIRIENSYGLVTVSPGSDREVRVRLKKVVYNDDELRAKQIADEIKLEGGAEGKAEASTFVVKTNRDSLASRDYRFNTEMEVLVPKKAPLQIRNSLGEVRVSNLAGKLDINTSHKPLEVRDCTGDFVISNRYDESRLVNLTGNTTVDARGRVYIETVKGDVTVRNEYAPVEVRDVDGKVNVSNSESSITLEKISKPVVVEGRGNQTTVHDLADTLKITASHQRVRISEVASHVFAESRYSTISLKNVKGNVDLASNSDRITAEEIGGSFKVQGQGSSVRANGVHGMVDVGTSLKEVIVNGFVNGCKIANEYADVTLSTDTLGKGDVSVKNKNGDIELFLPDEAAFQIDAVAKNGRAESDFPDLAPAESSGDVAVLKGKVKDGGPKIQLETEYSNIRVRLQSAESSGRRRNSEDRQERRRRDIRRTSN